MLGGVTLLIALLLLLKPSSVSWDAALVKAFLGNLLSGIVGGIAWEMRSQVILGRDRASHIGTSMIGPCQEKKALLTRSGGVREK
ncbi:MAG: hypothetical protein WBQ89_03995, partial [Candidatus Acidiferrum sp.]